MPPGREHALELGERARQVGDVVQDRVAEHEVEALVRERQRLGVGGHGLDLQAQPLGVGGEAREHARRDVAAGRLLDQAGAQHVQREIARPGADLERPRVVAGLACERLAHLGEHLVVAELAEVDAPLGVVVIGRHVVVARVDVADLLGAESRWHGRHHILARRVRASLRAA